MIIENIMLSRLDHIRKIIIINHNFILIYRRH